MGLINLKIDISAFSSHLTEITAELITCLATDRTMHIDGLLKRQPTMKGNWAVDACNVSGRSRAKGFSKSSSQIELIYPSRQDTRHFAGLRLGRCFAETDLMISLPQPLAGRGVLALATAAATSSSTSGCRNTSTAGRRMKRV